MIKKLLKLPYKVRKIIQAKRAISHLKSHNLPILREIGHALHESMINKNYAIEHELISKIEQRRTILLNTETKIPVIDYGAGSSDSNRPQEIMMKGVDSTAKVSTLCKASKNPKWAKLIFNILRKTQPSTCLELGTCVGISAAYQATALKLNNKGILLTLEGSPEIARIAEETFNSLGLSNVSVIIGPFHQTLNKTLESSKPIDILFNDGHHDHDAVIQNLNKSIPFLSDEAIILFDDIAWSSGMKKAWAEIENDKRVNVSINLNKMGIALIKQDCDLKEKHRVPF